MDCLELGLPALCCIYNILRWPNYGDFPQLENAITAISKVLLEKRPNPFPTYCIYFLSHISYTHDVSEKVISFVVQTLLSKSHEQTGHLLTILKHCYPIGKQKFKRILPILENIVQDRDEEVLVRCSALEIIQVLPIEWLKKWVEILTNVLNVDDEDVHVLMHAANAASRFIEILIPKTVDIEIPD